MNTPSSPILDEDALPFTYPDGTAIKDAPPIPMEGDPNMMDADVTQHQESRDSDMLGGKPMSPHGFPNPITGSR